MELFAKPVNGFELLAYFAKKCYLGSKYVQNMTSIYLVWSGYGWNLGNCGDVSNEFL